MISVITPSYKCGDCLEALTERIEGALQGSSFEFVIVDDGSPGNDWDCIERLRRQKPFVKGVKLSRNFGQQAAITAGIAHAKGDLLVVMDCDLQDPPEKIPEMIEMHRYSKCQIVFGERNVRRRDFRYFASRLFFNLLSKVTGVPLDGRHGCFSLITRRVADAYLQLKELDRHYIFALKWLGFSSTALPYTFADRFAGSSSYSIRRLLKHAISGVMFQTDVFLKQIIKVGLLITVGSLIYVATMIVRYFVGQPPEGWTTLVVLVSFFSGLIIFYIGVVSLYLSNVFMESKQRPIFVVEKLLG